MKCIVKIDINKPIEECPTFEFENMSDAARFIRTCFENDYDVYIKPIEEEEHEHEFEQVRDLWKDS